MKSVKAMKVMKVTKKATGAKNKTVPKKQSKAMLVAIEQMMQLAKSQQIAVKAMKKAMGSAHNVIGAKAAALTLINCMTSSLDTLFPALGIKETRQVMLYDDARGATVKMLQALVT